MDRRRSHPAPDGGPAADEPGPFDRQAGASPHLAPGAAEACRGRHHAVGAVLYKEREAGGSQNKGPGKAIPVAGANAVLPDPIDQFQFMPQQGIYKAVAAYHAIARTFGLPDVGDGLLMALHLEQGALRRLPPALPGMWMPSPGHSPPWTRICFPRAFPPPARGSPPPLPGSTGSCSWPASRRTQPMPACWRSPPLPPPLQSFRLAYAASGRRRPAPKSPERQTSARLVLFSAGRRFSWRAAPAKDAP